jgi:hypothetical protein
VRQGSPFAPLPSQSEEAGTAELVREGQEQDEELSEVRKWVLDKAKPTNLQQLALTAEGKKLAGLFDSLNIDNECFVMTSLMVRRWVSLKSGT